MIDLDAVGAGFAEALSSIAGLRTYDGYRDKPEPPCAFPILVPPLELAVTFDDEAEANFQIVVMVPFVDDRSAIAKLNGHIAAVVDKLQDATTLGGACSSVSAERLSGYAEIAGEGAGRYLAARVDVRVWL